MSVYMCVDMYMSVYEYVCISLYIIIYNLHRFWVFWPKSCIT